MIRLDDVLSSDAYNYHDILAICQRRGSDPLSVIIDIEDKLAIRDNIEVLMRALSPSQCQVLLLTGLGYSSRSIASILNREHSTILGIRRSIHKRLFSIANPDRIRYLKRALHSLKKRGSLYRKLRDEYFLRLSVRKALDNLRATVIDHKKNFSLRRLGRPSSLFERLISAKKNEPCKLRLYLDKSFGDSLTVCTLCKQCRCKQN